MDAMRACDRCRRTGEVSEGFSRELCVLCAVDFAKWIDAGKKSKAKPPRAQVGAPWKIIGNLIAKHGSVTAEQYGDVTGQTGRTPYYVLRSFVRKGMLETDRMHDGQVRFFITVSRWQANAEAAE